MLWSSFTALVFAIAAASTAADERHDHGPWNNPLWGPKAASKPNILFIFTDDQDLQLGSLNYLPAVTNRIQKHGMILIISYQDDRANQVLRLHI